MSEDSEKKTIDGHQSVGPVLTGEKPGDQIGPYRLMSVIGEGGFGVVWLAERRAPMVQRVALKVIKPGMDSRAVIARFEQERQALAVMDHANVARVYDGGVTPSGRPYFVMEYVPGEPITEYADRHKLPIRQRLELFMAVCEAVQHAHHKGIIHRDIKPGNILVSSHDGIATAKVIDFGVAKAVSHTLTDKTIFTETGQLIGTPEYMSPEQAEMGRLDVDTRTDVYSLGVVLYELLAGVLPFDGKELRSKGYLEIQRVIREVEPPRPSTRLSTVGGEEATAIAVARCEGTAGLRGALRRELDWIPLKAMRKDRGRRYGSPAELARDVRRYLEGRPLDAAPESKRYRLGKYLRRNRLVVGAVVTVVVALAVTAVVLGVSLWKVSQSERAARAAEAVAEGQRSRTAAALGVLEGVLVAADTEHEHDPNLRVRDLLGRAHQRINKELAGQPDMQARLLRTVGAAYRSLGLYEDAAGTYRDAVASSERAGGRDSEDVLESLHGFVAAMIQNYDSMTPKPQAMIEEVVAAHERLLALCKKHYGENDPRTTTLMVELTQVRQAAAAGALDAESAARKKTAFLGTMGLLRGMTPEAVETEMEAGIARAERLMDEGKQPEAQAAIKAFMQPYLKTILRSEMPEGMCLFASQWLLHTGQPKSVPAVVEVAVEMGEEVYGPNSQQLFKTLLQGADVLVMVKHYDRAGELTDRAIAFARERMAGKGKGLTSALQERVLVFAKAGRFAEAVPCYEELVSRGGGMDPIDYFWYASGLQAKGRNDDALTQAEHGWATMPEKTSVEDRRRLANQIAELQRLKGNAPEAERWKKIAEELGKK